MSATHDWVAIDGKVFRGTLASGDKQSVVFAVSHAARTLLAQAPMHGSTASDIPVVRDLLKHSQLEARKMTLDAHHCNPTTTAHMHQAGGQGVIRIKENQKILLTPCQSVAAAAVPLGSHDACEKGHGRLAGNGSERAAWRRLVQPGGFYVVDRGYVDDSLFRTCTTCRAASSAG